MAAHRHEPESNGWYTTSPTSSWNAECKHCGARIVLVHRYAPGQVTYWRSERSAPRIEYGNAW
jgi:DsbC/DsbD-like thiol-disulfide interchange protein